MLRDGVCDEVANVAKCLYDGGDCCKENKDKGLCRNCTCVLKIDHEDLVKKFKTLDIKPVEDVDKLQTAIDISSNGWTVEVEDVLSVQVCTTLCLEHEEVDKLNAWHYNVSDSKCKCGWVESNACPEKMVINDWIADTQSLDHYFGYVQLYRTVPCGKPLLMPLYQNKCMIRLSNGWITVDRGDQ